MTDTPDRPPIDSSGKPANVQWGGRFAGGPSLIMQDINASIGFDRKLWRQDIRGSRAHAAMLARIGIISAEDEAAIGDGLEAIAHGYREPAASPFDVALEDIHMNIEARLTERIGEAGKRLHTARSRNDQVATDFRLWVRDAIDGLTRADPRRDAGPGGARRGPCRRPDAGLHSSADRAAGDVRPSPAGLCGDAGPRPRAAGGLPPAAECVPARAPPRWPAPPSRSTATMTAAALDFDRPTANSLDAVSDRDFALEFLAAAAISAMHLSRLAEEIVIWCSAPFRFIRLSDAFTTGCSIMPQKRNPDAAELVRAKTGRMTGALVAC